MSVKTISQLAKEIGVSRQAVYQKTKRYPLSEELKEFTKTVNGKVYICDKGVEMVYKAFESFVNNDLNDTGNGNNDLSNTVSQSNNDTDNVVNDIINHDKPSSNAVNSNNNVDNMLNSIYNDVLTKTIDILQEQLKAKDEQIKQLQADIALERERNTNKDEQILNALSIMASAQEIDRQKLLADTIIDSKKEKSHWWKKPKKNI